MHILSYEGLATSDVRASADTGGPLLKSAVTDQRDTGQSIGQCLRVCVCGRPISCSMIAAYACVSLR